MRYETDDDLKRAKAFYDELGQGSAAFFSWTFAAGLILVQINGDLPEAKAQRYEAVLENLTEVVSFVGGLSVSGVSARQLRASNPQ